jgi:hypothetical protein
VRAALVAAAALVLGLAGCGSDDAPESPNKTHRPPASFFGIVSEDVLAGDRAYRRRTLARERAAGVRLIRQTFHWDRIERAPRRYDFSEYDAYVAEVARARLDLLPILFTPPPFRATPGSERGTYPPDRPEDMAALAKRLVHRYGPRGEFWQANPSVPERPIRAWQIWNEPNLPAYWPQEPDPAEYTRLLEVVAKAVKGADADATVVSAGLSESRQGVPFREFVTGMFEAGAGEWLDSFGLHAFARDAADSVAAARSVRTLLDELGSSASIWITEIGWASGGPPSPFTVGPRAQAARIQESLSALFRLRRELRLDGVVYYNWRDAPVYEGGQDFFGLHTGLLDSEGDPKPALKSYQEVTKKHLDR